MGVRFSRFRASLTLLAKAQPSVQARVGLLAGMGIVAVTTFAACSETAGPTDTGEQAVAASAGAAHASSGPVRGTRTEGVMIKTHPRRRMDVVSADVRVDGDGDGLVDGMPAKSYVDWHTHPGPTVVIVTGGTLTMNHSSDCRKILYGPNSVFVPPEEIHLASNESGTDIVLRATFFLPEGAPPTMFMPEEYSACGL